MGLLDSIKSAVTSSYAKVAEALEQQTQPAPPAPAPTAPGFSNQSSFVGGKATPYEDTVARRLDRNVPMNLVPSSQTERMANLTRLTQIDGNQNSDQDRTTCGVQCVVASMYLKHPEQLPKVAAYLTDKQGANLDQWAKECGLDPKQARADLEAIKSGKASPRQISTMSQLLFRDTKARTDKKLDAMSPLARALIQNQPAAGDGGLNRDALQILTKDILKDECGCQAGPIEMSLRSVPGGGAHWVAQIDVASMADIEENAKNDMVVTFDPAPNQFGLSPTGVAFNRAGADAQQADARGKPLEEIDIGADGKVTKEEPLPIPPDLIR
jgi:hypothetical protein